VLGPGLGDVLPGAVATLAEPSSRMARSGAAGRGLGTIVFAAADHK